MGPNSNYNATWNVKFQLTLSLWKFNISPLIYSKLSATESI